MAILNVVSQSGLRSGGVGVAFLFIGVAFPFVGVAFLPLLWNPRRY